MTLKVDGTNGVLQAYDYQVLTTGFSYTFASGTQTLIAAPAGTLATGTITMPASPADGMVITVVSTQQVTAVTVQGNTGQTIAGAPTQLIPNQPLSFMYNLANTKWQPFAGGAGRASQLVAGTTVATTSGTSIDFTGIPSWARRITLVFYNVSTNGTSNMQVQIGNGSIVSSGYAAQSTNVQASVSATTSTSAYIIYAGNAANSVTGMFTLVQQQANTWVASFVLASTANNFSVIGAGVNALGGTLDRVRLTTAGGTDTFDAGSLNVFYE